MLLFQQPLAPRCFEVLDELRATAVAAVRLCFHGSGGGGGGGNSSVFASL